MIHQFKVHPDGRTAHEGIIKHKCTHLVVGFGGLIHRFAFNATPIAADTPILARGSSDWAPRRMYLMPSDVVRLGHTVGCPGFVWMQRSLALEKNTTAIAETGWTRH